MTDQALKLEPLPYDMGNAGDLIKHGLLAEYTSWWIKNKKNKFVFYDPFGGRPYVSPPTPIVKKRVEALDGYAFNNAQNNPDRYYGSGHIVKNICKVMNAECKIFTADRDDNAHKALLDSGLDAINLHK